MESQRGLVATVAGAWETMTGLPGYRLRPELGASFETLALLLSAGLTLMAISMPGVAVERVRARPFGAAEEAEWSLSALEIASVADAFLEEDPDVRWDAARSEAVRAAVDGLRARGPSRRRPRS